MKKNIKKCLMRLASTIIIFCTILSNYIWNNVENVYAKNIVVYSQTDSRWANVSYGLGPNGSRATISSAGCGILSYVNAVYYMTGNFVSPIELAKWSVNNGYRINGVGTSYGLYKAYADAYGEMYGFKYVGTATNVTGTKSHLKNGGTAIISVPGHLMALVDYNESSNKYLILDSYKSSNRGTYSSGYRWLTALEFTEKLMVSRIELISPITTVKDNIPQGSLDAVSGGTGSITVGGWAFDGDDVSRSLNIHVYIGGTAGSGAPCYRIKANKPREDVQKDYPGVGNNHGYHETIKTNKTGTQEVYVYAINEENGNQNPLLGHKTVTINSGSVPIGALDNVSGGIGYIDVGGWAFDSDDLSKALQIHVYIGGPAGTGDECHFISAGKKRADVTSVYPEVGNYHGYSERIYTKKTGKQKVYVYAINTGGGVVHNPLLGSKEVTIAEKPKVYPVEDISIVNEKGCSCENIWIESVGKSVALQAEVYPNNATNKNVIWTTSDSSVVSVKKNGTVTAVGNGVAYVIAATEDGNYESRCQVKVGMNNIVYGDIDFNGKITISDLSTVNSVINGNITLTDTEKIIVDVDGDGKVTINDRELMSQYIVGSIDAFPIETMLSEIKLTKLPNKLSYFKGDSITTNGMVVTAIYRNGSSKVVTDYSVSGSLDIIGKQKITVSYNEAGVTRTESYMVEVKAIELDRIMIVRAPNKTSYIQGERFDASGLIVRAKYSNGINRIIYNYTVENDTDLTVGEYNIKISYKENGKVKYAYQKITVTDLCDVYGHTWNTGVITKSPTTAMNGIRTYTCTTCKKVKTETIPKQGVSTLGTAESANQRPQMKVWFSDTKMGTQPDKYSKGKMYYLCYELIDGNTGKAWKGSENCDYTVNETIYKPDGSIAHTYTYKDDNNWISHRVDQEGTYKGIVRITGYINGTITTEFTIDSTYSYTENQVPPTNVITPTIHPETGADSDKEETDAEEESGDNDIETEYEEEVEDEEPILPEVGDMVLDIEGKAEYEVISIKGDEVCVEYTEPRNKKSKNVKIPNVIETEEGIDCKVTAIASGAFRNNKYVKKIVVGNNVTTIGAKAFSGCRNLTSVIMGSSIKTIGANTFSNCSKLTKLTIPAKVTKICSNAFYGCKKLKTLTIKSKKLTSKSIAKKAFKNLPNKVKVEVPKGKGASYKKLFRQKGLNTKVKITEK